MNPTLYITLRSPFARRSRLMLEELGIQFNLETIDVFNPPAQYSNINPLNRVPSLVFPTGETIVDSAQIQSYYRAKFPSHPLFLTGGIREEKLFQFSAIAMGIMDYTVDYFLEQKRGPGLSMPHHLLEYKTAIENGLKFLEQNIYSGPFFTGAVLRVCDLDIGTALAYAQLRVDRGVLTGYPKLLKYLDGLNSRPGFLGSAPPA